jgi:hypothetical protein
LFESRVTLVGGGEWEFGDILSGEFAGGDVLLAELYRALFLSQTAAGLNHAGVGH